jgi:AcrR family transcriptional regulator
MRNAHIDNVINSHILGRKRNFRESGGSVTGKAARPSGGEGPKTGGVASGRAPTQQRSRERVERILAVATALIAREGSDALRMSEIAEAAAVSIGSLYQYFPDKSAVLREIAERYNAEGRRCVQLLLDPVKDEAGLLAALMDTVDGYYAMFQAEPVMRDIWSATQADKTLLDLDLADVQAHGAMLAAVLRRLKPRRDIQRLEADCYLIMHLLAAAVRQAIALEAGAGAALLASFKRLVLQPAVLEALGAKGRH